MKYNDNGEYKDIYVKAFDTLPVGTEVDYDGSTVPDGWEEVDTYDSGWQTLTLTSTFNVYDSSNPVQYRKIGKTVYLKGTLTSTQEITANSTTIIGTLPQDYRPTNQVWTICHGSGMNIWLLSIQANGNLTIERYGTATNIAIPSGAWLPISSISWLVD